MKTIYIKNEIDNIISKNLYFYKVVEVKNDEVLTLEVTDSSITIDQDEEFYHQVGFVKNKLCSTGKVEEIQRAEFDEFYKKTVEKINNLSSL